MTFPGAEADADTYHLASDVGRVRALWLVVLVATSVAVSLEAIGLGRWSNDAPAVASSLPLDRKLVGALTFAMATWILALVWIHPQAEAIRPRSKIELWYLLSVFVVAFGCVPAHDVATRQGRQWIAWSCDVVSLGLLALMYPRARSFPEGDPPPALPAWHGAIEVKPLACPHCGARTFSRRDKLAMNSSVLRACRKCGAWVTVSWISYALQWMGFLAAPRAVDFAERLPLTDGTRLLLSLPMMLVVFAAGWAAGPMLLPLVTRYPPPRR